MIQDASVSVLDSKGNRLLEGRTDGDGRVSFEIPQKTDLTVVLNAAMGHRAEWNISARDLIEASEDQVHAAENQRPAEAGNPTPVVMATDKGNPGTHNQSEAPITRREMEDLINDALDHKLKPLFALVAESASGKPGLTEVVGGIGYIVGIAGLALYLANRKKNGRNSS